MLETRYQAPPPDLLEAVNNGELIFFVIGYSRSDPFILIEWAAGVDESNAIVCESLYRGDDLLIAQPGNELRKSLADQVSYGTSKSDTISLDFRQLMSSPATSYGISMLQLSQLNNPSNFIRLKT